MAQTVLTITSQNDVKLGVKKTVITIPTTVDASGATCDFLLPRAYSIGIQAISTNWNAKNGSLQAAPDQTNYTALPTAITFAGANGIKSVVAIDCGFCFYRFNIDGAPTATVTVTIISNHY